MSAMAGAQRPGRRYTAEEDSKVVDEFFADPVSSKWFLNKTMEIIQTIDVFVHFIYLHQYPVKKTTGHWKFLRKNFFFRFDEKMKSKMAAMRSHDHLIMQNAKKNKKTFFPIVQPLAHPNTNRIAKKISILGAFISKSLFFYKKKGCSTGGVFTCSSERVKMLKYASKYFKIPAQVMKIVIFHYGWLKKAEIPNGPCRKSMR
jgi:hypothetical protein